MPHVLDSGLVIANYFTSLEPFPFSGNRTVFLIGKSFCTVWMVMSDNHSSPLHPSSHSC